jgi:hypothetical protein
VLLRGGVAGAASDTSFLQAYALARWFKGLDKDSRLLVRGELGHTFSGELDLLPPTLRFHAGGDRSIRGYGWREVGPRVGPVGDEFPVGARNVITGSIEYERYFNGPWGMAVFVDSGSAFDSNPEWRTGVGLGLRWRSPLGPLRLDIAHGLTIRIRRCSSRSTLVPTCEPCPRPVTRDAAQRFALAACAARRLGERGDGGAHRRAAGLAAQHHRRPRLPAGAHRRRVASRRES